MESNLLHLTVMWRFTLSSVSGQGFTSICTSIINSYLKGVSWGHRHGSSGGATMRPVANISVRSLQDWGIVAVLSDFQELALSHWGLLIDISRCEQFTEVAMEEWGWHFIGFCKCSTMAEKHWHLWQRVALGARHTAQEKPREMVQSKLYQFQWSVLSGWQKNDKNKCKKKGREDRG